MIVIVQLMGNENREARGPLNLRPLHRNCNRKSLQFSKVPPLLLVPSSASGTADDIIYNLIE